MKLILSTSNVMNGGPSIIHRPTIEKSNTELVTSLRTNFLAAQQDASPSALTTGASTPSSMANGATPKPAAQKPPYQSWTRQEGDILYVPAIDWTTSGLAEERSQYDITVKLFYLPHVPASRRCEHTKEAISLVLKELRINSIDLLIVSFPGIAFDADDEDEEDSDGGSGGEFSGHDNIETLITTWRTLEKLHEDGTIAQLGAAEFGSQRLARFLPHTKVRPSVDQINVRDCCVVPKPLILYAKQEGIELLTHNDCTDILPPGTLRELLGPGEKGAGLLAEPKADGPVQGLRGDVEPQWVVKYTAVVKDRGVVENKGYFAMAELRDRKENECGK